MAEFLLEDGLILAAATFLWAMIALVAAICIKLVSIQKSVNTIRDTRTQRAKLKLKVDELDDADPPPDESTHISEPAQ